MPNLTQVTLASGKPVDSGTVSTIDGLMAMVAKESGGNLAAILAKLSADPATQTTLAAVLAKLSADPATQTTLASVLTGINALRSTGTLDGIISALATTNAKDFATQTTLAAAKTDLDTLAGAVTSSKMATKAASGDFADGAIATVGVKADAASTATDATAITAMSVWKQISKSIQLMVFGAGTAAAAQRTTLASDDPAVAVLGATSGAKVVTDANGTAQQYLRGLVSLFASGASPAANITPVFASTGVVTLQSNATGTTYNTFASQASRQITLVNDTGVDLEVQFGGSGSTFILWANTALTIPGISNNSSVGYRRKDTSNTQVTLAAFWNS